ncbi:hypothetical protein ABIF65_004312 [Bradyrhizobium japonicum]|jgi:hypothetical protein|uniref:hypothetical protein n=1 Tax=Bradyrhizobium TaxID=374 RepID=UPI00041BB0C8|nr:MULTISPECIES: hypothetical protein [Bradyrhizobium]MBR0883787.1 hypothetical protein [Bradyrhizobium liaoningense]MBR0946112.1 hypothetical protein [Bradyrhizobium liaoningense]MBR1003565.1 hypothetical protein [Bradyrhizobium liaoningense]MBR1033969.1 hypothetical protein [Bradyrhizobium liaoningense]MBR1066203.1 hypothetical protein [Bradyrhizobium liaoningense]
MKVRPTRPKDPGPIEKLDLPDGLTYPDNGHTMLSRLVQLGMASEQPTRVGEAIMDRGKQTGVRNFNEFVLTPWGKQFMRAATPPSPRAPDDEEMSSTSA